MYPQVHDGTQIGEYPALAKAGGGDVWDAVLEYRVWRHATDGDDYYYVFAHAEEALAFSETEPNAEAPLALVLQREYIDESEPGCYLHVQQERVTEWPLAFLSRPRRTDTTIPDFMSPDAPANRLDILRGLA